jgi:hypothetical protein
MNSFFKKASIVLLVIVLVPVIAFLAYLAWLERQESEVAVTSLKCEGSGKSKYFRISKKRKSDTPDYLSTLNAETEDAKVNSDDLFFTHFELKKLTAEYADYHLSEMFLRLSGVSRSEVVETIFRVHRETLTITTLEDGKEVSKRECEEISEREIMKIARKNLAAATKDRKF